MNRDSSLLDLLLQIILLLVLIVGLLVVLIFDTPDYEAMLAAARKTAH